MVVIDATMVVDVEDVVALLIHVLAKTLFALVADYPISTTIILFSLVSTSVLTYIHILLVMKILPNIFKVNKFTFVDFL